MRRMYWWAAVAVLFAGIGLAAPAAAEVDVEKAKERAAERGEVMNFGRLPVYVGIQQRAFGRLLNAWEKENRLEVTDRREIGLLFDTYDLNDDGRLGTFELRLTFDPEAVEELKKRKKKKGGGKGDEQPSCISNTCSCDGNVAAETVDAYGGGTIDGEPMPQPSPGPNTSQWCGGDCHCHCNTRTCALNGT